MAGEAGGWERRARAAHESAPALLPRGGALLHHVQVDGRPPPAGGHPADLVGHGAHREHVGHLAEDAVDEAEGVRGVLLADIQPRGGGQGQGDRTTQRHGETMTEGSMGVRGAWVRGSGGERTDRRTLSSLQTFRCCSGVTAQRRPPGCAASRALRRIRSSITCVRGVVREGVQWDRATADVSD